jgi:hypothetical protein
MEKLKVTVEDIQRFKILMEVIDRKLRITDASAVLSLSYRHTLRLKDKVRDEGLEGLLRKSPSSPANKRLTDQMIKEILRLRREFYHDFNMMHFKDKLEEEHHILLSYESLRQVLIKAQQHAPRKKKVVHRRRRRMPKAGMLVQMDSSQHQWLSNIAEKWWLIAMIDDATNEIPYAGLFPQDTTFANMYVIRRAIEIKGVFMSLYVDKASHFKTTRHGGLHYNVSREPTDTQIERALEELGITLIPANSPQAKGRIEVTFRLFQDRFIKEMRLAGIRDYDEANRFLQDKFLPWYHAKYTHEAQSAYMPLPKGKNLDLVFCIKDHRKVKNDNTVRFNGHAIQIPPTDIKLSFARTRVDVCLWEDQRILILYKDKVIATSVLSENNKSAGTEKKIEKLLNKREYVPVIRSKSSMDLCKPSADHPWRKIIDRESKIKQMGRALKRGDGQV